MLGAATLLLLFQLAGEVTVQILGLPVPGPVVGMLLLFATLAIKGSAPKNLRRTAQGILSHLSLLFVPAGVGVMLYIPRIAKEWLPILAALVVSTLATIAVTAFAMNQLMTHAKPDQKAEKEEK